MHGLDAWRVDSPSKGVPRTGIASLAESLSGRPERGLRKRFFDMLGLLSASLVAVCGWEADNFVGLVAAGINLELVVHTIGRYE
jgi:hypothetical protein